MSTASDPAPVLEVRGLSKRFTRDLRRSQLYGVLDILGELRPGHERRAGLRRGEFWAVRDVGFEVRPGEALGIVGHNGAGKSTLLRLLNGLLVPDAGTLRVRGTTAALIELGVPFSTVLTGRENIVASAALLGIGVDETDDFIARVADFAELEHALDAPIRTYSSGMQMRLGYAIAAQAEPDLLLVDEVVAVGDIAFQRKCVQHITRYLRRGGALVMVSHDLWMVQAICERCLVMAGGEVVDDTTPNRAISAYLGVLRRGSLAPARPSQVDRSDAPDDEADVPAAVDVDALVASGPGGEVVTTGGALEIALRVRALEEPRQVVPVIEVHAANLGICVARIRPPEGEATIRVPLEGTEVRCRVPSLPLFPGLFRLTARLEATTGEPIGPDDATTTFEVESSGTRLETLAQISAVVSTIDGAFEVERRPPGSGAVAPLGADGPQRA